MVVDALTPGSAHELFGALGNGRLEAVRFPEAAIAAKLVFGVTHLNRQQHGQDRCQRNDISMFLLFLLLDANYGGVNLGTPNNGILKTYKFEEILFL
jgi:hypothetical protein